MSDRFLGAVLLVGAGLSAAIALVSVWSKGGDDE